MVIELVILILRRVPGSPDYWTSCYILRGGGYYLSRWLTFPIPFHSGETSGQSPEVICSTWSKCNGLNTRKVLVLCDLICRLLTWTSACWVNYQNITCVFSKSFLLIKVYTVLINKRWLILLRQLSRYINGYWISFRHLIFQPRPSNKPSCSIQTILYNSSSYHPARCQK
jgi:hypothetical protein